MGINHTWKFFRAGGFDQVRLDSGSDLLALEELDQKLWVALACPTTGLEFDSKTLALIDTDNDGRIRVPELIAAIKWAGLCLKSADDLLKGSPELPLSAINEATPEGKKVLAAAKHLLENLGKPEATLVTLEDTADTAKIFAQTRFNGDGIIPTDSAQDAATKAVLEDIIACMGPEADRSGKPGVNQAKVEQFFKEAQAFSDWWQQAETDSTILPLDGAGQADSAARAEATIAAAVTLKSLRAKLDDYFTRCRLAAFDPRAINALNREEKEYLVFTGKNLSLASAEIASLPLAQVAPGKPLPLTEGLNPAWAGAMARFTTQIVRPLLNGQPCFTEADWGTITSRFAPYETWLAAKPTTAVEKLGLARVRDILGSKAQETILALIAKDKALEPESNSIAVVERLVRYYRDLYKLANNFVSFRDFYSRKDKAIFQAGTLYLDQRSCDLCLKVADSGKHAVMASLAGTYLAYCDCSRKGTSNETMQIVAAFTDGDSDNLMVGRNGIFYDRKGRDWDVTIKQILDNPISIRQAFWAPYKKAARMVQEQIAKRAATADEEAATKLVSAAQKLEEAAIKGPPAPAATAAAPPPKKIDPGLIAALSVGAAGIGGMLGGIISGFLNLKGLMPLGVLAIIMIISGPSMLLAWLKLRKRNLGPILDANGWAVNAKAKINVPFGASLTKVATLPTGAQRDLVDPFAEKKNPWPKIIIITGIVLFLVYEGLVFSYEFLDKMGYINEWTHGRLGTPKPAITAPAVPGTTAAPAPAAPAAKPAAEATK
jgi:hypothetical protein